MGKRPFSKSSVSILSGKGSSARRKRDVPAMIFNRKRRFQDFLRPEGLLSDATVGSDAPLAQAERERQLRQSVDMMNQWINSPVRAAAEDGLRRILRERAQAWALDNRGINSLSDGF